MVPLVKSTNLLVGVAVAIAVVATGFVLFQARDQDQQGGFEAQSIGADDSSSVATLPGPKDPMVDGSVSSATTLQALAADGTTSTTVAATATAEPTTSVAGTQPPAAPSSAAPGSAPTSTSRSDADTSGTGTSVSVDSTSGPATTAPSGNTTEVTTAVPSPTTPPSTAAPSTATSTTAPAPTTTTAPAPTTTAPPTIGDGFPANIAFDYQIGSPYDPPTGVAVVSRDWHAANPLPGAAYSICYVNAFQTQPDGSGGRIDEQSNWPADVVLTSLGDDPNWEGEFLIDLSTGAKRATAAAHVAKMVDGCAAKGFDAVEFDNLDSWTRISGLPFGRADAIAFAELITAHAHNKGLAVAQKNTVDLTVAEAKNRIGFDFAIVESCGQYNECGAVAAVHGANAIYIEYSDEAFERACSVVGAQSSVVRRNRSVSAPGSSGYIYDEC